MSLGVRCIVTEAAVAMPVSITREAISSTYQAIAPHIRRTPVMSVDGAESRPRRRRRCSSSSNCSQHTGSFKTRGAFANLLTRDVPAAGVVAASGGNHGAAVAYAAMRLGVPATHLRAGDRLAGQDRPHPLLRRRPAWSAASATPTRWPRVRAMSPTPAPCRCMPSTSPRRCWARARSGSRSRRQAPDIDTLLVAVGGGGLIGGIAAWCGGAGQGRRRRARTAPTLHAALAARAAGRRAEPAASPPTRWRRAASAS